MRTWMLAPLLVLLLGAGLLATFVCFLAAPVQASSQTGASALVEAAQTLQEHLQGPYATIYSLDDALMRRVYQFWVSSCGSKGVICSEAVSGHLQCVMFVTAVFFLAGDTLPFVGNAQDFWGAYAHQTGWQEVGGTASQASARGLPQPGDLMVWRGGAFGHIAVVIDVTPPGASTDGTVTVAQANEAGNRWLPQPSGQPNPTPGNVLTLALHPDRSVTTDLPSFAGYQVLGYLRERRNTVVPHSASTPLPEPATLPAGLPHSPYVSLAWKDATEVGIDPALFVRQINQESGFQPNVVSVAGAIGIAQFMPTTAAGLGIDPHDPVASLHAAAQDMHEKVQQYHGDYAQALAAYNAGEGTVQAAQQRCGLHWVPCLPQETQHYLHVILAPAA